MRPVMALMPLDGEVRKAPVIQRATLRYIFFNLVIFDNRGTLEEP